MKDWKPHIKDWNPGDPTWQGDKGKGIIGAVNYLASKSLNAVSFLTMNIRGDDQNVFPYVAYDDYKLPQNDLQCEDFRSRDKTWDYCRIALDFFGEREIPFWEMRNADALVGNVTNGNSKYCLARPGSLYLVYLPEGGTTEIDLSDAHGTFTVQWFDPRHGGPLQQGSSTKIQGGSKAALGTPPKDTTDDWLLVISQNQSESPTRKGS